MPPLVVHDLRREPQLNKDAQAHSRRQKRRHAGEDVKHRVGDGGQLAVLELGLERAQRGWQQQVLGHAVVRQGPARP